MNICIETDCPYNIKAMQENFKISNIHRQKIEGSDNIKYGIQEIIMEANRKMKLLFDKKLVNELKMTESDDEEQEDENRYDMYLVIQQGFGSFWDYDERKKTLYVNYILMRIYDLKYKKFVNHFIFTNSIYIPYCLFNKINQSNFEKSLGDVISDYYGSDRVITDPYNEIVNVSKDKIIKNALDILYSSLFTSFSRSYFPRD